MKPTTRPGCAGTGSSACTTSSVTCGRSTASSSKGDVLSSTSGSARSNPLDSLRGQEVALSAFYSRHTLAAAFRGRLCMFVIYLKLS